jgi:ribosomal protein S18 acetylase RimI-like enzyme
MAEAIQVRAIRPGEGAVLVEMVRELAQSHDLMQHFKATPQLYEETLFQDNPVVGALIAEVGGVPAGCAIWHRSFSTFRGREVMYLEDLSVLPRFRRQGVGKALLRATARLAVARGYPSIYWIIMDWNDGARALYQEVGADMENGMTWCRLHGEKLEALAQ